MIVLLDTHTFLWWIMDVPGLASRARETIEADENDVLLSVASTWEIAIKASLGKIKVPGDVREYVPNQMTLNGIQPLSVNMNHALHTYTLPWHHRDPFDRMLVAQAQIESIPIISGDRMISRYDVQVIW